MDAHRSQRSCFINNNHLHASKNISKELPKSPDKKARRIPRRGHAAMTLARCPVIPITSPAGMKLVKDKVSDEYLSESLQRIEQMCPAPPLDSDGSNRPRFLDRRRMCSNQSTYRRNGELHSRTRWYDYPRRQLSRRRQEEAKYTLQGILCRLHECRPCSVSLKRLTDSEIESIKARLRRDSCQGPAPKVARSEGGSWIVDYIDLCASDEEEQSASPSNHLNGTKENDVNFEDIDLKQGNKSVDLHALKSNWISPSTKHSEASTDQDTLQYFSNNQSVSISRSKPLQHQNTTSCRYPQDNANQIEITLKKINAQKSIQSNNNLVSIDLTTC